MDIEWVAHHLWHIFLLEVYTVYFCVQKLSCETYGGSLLWLKC